MWPIDLAYRVDDELQMREFWRQWQTLMSTR
jgi:hypothetical protein